jgi:hypothetical protein
MLNHAPDLANLPERASPLPEFRQFCPRAESARIGARRRMVPRTSHEAGSVTSGGPDLAPRHQAKTGKTAQQERKSCGQRDGCHVVVGQDDVVEVVVLSIA